MKKPDRIYLDHQATTPADPSVVDAMLPWLRAPANAHADNPSGRAALEAVECARAQVAALIGADHDEITFTSGATEAVNIAIRSMTPPGSRVLASSIEHACVLATVAELQDVQVEFLAVDQDGLLCVDDVAEAIGSGASLVIAMAVNNELGTVQPFAGIGAACRFAGVPYLCDLAQAAGRIPIEVHADGISLGSISSHKIYGPQGIGALFHARHARVGLRPLATGGGQEGGLRPVPVPVALAVGFGAACALAASALAADARQARAAAEAFMAVVARETPDAWLNGSATERVPHNLNLTFPGVDADALLAAVPEIQRRHRLGVQLGRHRPIPRPWPPSGSTKRPPAAPFAWASAGARRPTKRAGPQR